ncbi:DNA glycosylase [Helicostylum pulchrum]|nr:DNA glycosylase [Helicostylum pulchrum]
MSLRRSSRHTQHVVDTGITKKRTITTPKSSPNVKKVKKELDIDSNPLQQQQAPKDWDIVYDILETYRKVHKAAVDTMGCARLADRTCTPKVQRFQTLVSLMLSAQTKDTVTSAAVIKLQKELEGGLCLESILRLDEAVLDNMIRSVGFHTKKASYIKRTAEILRDTFDGDIPDTIEGLTSLPGVGPKMGYLTLQVAWNKNLGIGVDVHVHRIANRLGWVKTKTPEETRLSWLPKDKWRNINPILVGYGQIVCLPRGPLCHTCPVRAYCPSAVIKVKKTETTSVYFKKEEDLEW